MKTYDYTPTEQSIIATFDKINHEFWNEKVTELSPLRLNLRVHYLAEQNFRCCYCKMLKQEKHGSTWDVEHIVPKALFPHFLFEQKNLSLACKECNEEKSNKNVFKNQTYKYIRYPKKSNAYSIIHPHFDKYSDHMSVQILPDGKIFHIPKTEKGITVFHHCKLIRFSMQSFNAESINSNLLTSFSSLIDTHKNLTPEEAKAYFKAALPRPLCSEYIDC